MIVHFGSTSDASVVARDPVAAEFEGGGILGLLGGW